MEHLVPKVLSIVVLLISIAMIVLLSSTVIAMWSGSAVSPIRWAVPLGILATGAVMSWMLTRKTIPLQLYVVAFALWVLTAGYCFTLLR